MAAPALDRFPVALPIVIRKRELLNVKKTELLHFNGQTLMEIFISRSLTMKK